MNTQDVSQHEVPKSESTQQDTENSNDTNSSSNIDKRDSGKTSPTNTSDNIEPKIKYVEAPIPKVNPWKKAEIPIEGKESNDCQKYISDECKIQHTDISDKPVDESTTAIEVVHILNSSKLAKQEENKQNISGITGQIVTTAQNKSPTKVTATNSSQNMNTPNEEGAEDDGNTILPLTSTTVWRGTADTISKLAPLKDDKVSSLYLVTG